MFRLNLASDTTNPTIRQIAKLIRRTVKVCDDASVGFFLAGSVIEQGRSYLFAALNSKTYSGRRLTRR